MRIAHAVTALNGRFVEVDEAFCELLHLSSGELFTRTIMDVTVSEDHSLNFGLLQKLIEHGIDFWIDKRYVKTNGAVVSVRNYVSRVITEDGRLRIAATVFDLRSQATIEQMLDVANKRASGIREQTETLKKLLSGTTK